MSYKCVACGFESSTVAKFCLQCGATVASSAEARITVRLNLKYGNGTVFNNCWNLPDEYINSGYGQVVSILGHREYQSYITLTIPYGTSAQRMIENSDKVQLSIENSAACEKSNYIY